MNDIHVYEGNCAAHSFGIIHCIPFRLFIDARRETPAFDAVLHALSFTTDFMCLYKYQLGSRQNHPDHLATTSLAHLDPNLPISSPHINTNPRTNDRVPVQLLRPRLRLRSPSLATTCDPALQAAARNRTLQLAW